MVRGQARRRNRAETYGTRRGPGLLTWLLAPLATLLLALRPSGPPPPGQAPTIARCELTGTVDAGSAAYLVDCIHRAERAGDEALLIRLDTPGGSLEATRQIVGALMDSRVPVLIWVGPAGARAASAGTFLALAAHFTAMAPGTNIGAAHPVEGPAGADPEQSGGKHLAEKIENDAAAFAESIAHQRGRNEQWAAQAVRESVSVSARRAVELHVVDLVATTAAEALAGADGHKVLLPSGEHVLRTKGAVLLPLSPTPGQRLVHGLANPSLAYLLFLIGAFGLIIELSHPGAIAPGAIGVTCLVLALVAFSVLPIRTGAVLLLVAGMGLIFAELHASHGALALSGVVLLALGGVMLIDRANPGWMVERPYGLSLWLVLPTAVFIGGGAAFVVLRGAQARRLPQRGGDAGLVGEHGTSLSPLSPRGGEVFVHGERWRAVADRELPEAAEVVVRGIDGLTLYVEEVGHVPVGERGSPRPPGDPARAVHLRHPDHQRV